MRRAPNKKLPPLELLNSLLKVDHDSPSGLRWRKPQARCLKPGMVAGSQTATGYWRVSITVCGVNKKYFVHRIIYYMQTGEDPVDYQIDHVNDQKDNLNVRKATPLQNKGNTRKIPDCETYQSSSRYKGVTRRKVQGGVKWEASLMHNHRYIYIGRFNTEEDAASAYNNAAAKIWGEFARLNEIE